jgi:bifunctional non-homologous end joining protein LigD
MGTIGRSLSPDHRATLRVRSTSFVLDGEAVLFCVGISDFDGLHSRKHNEEV